MKVDFVHKIEYTNNNSIAVADVANSLIANKAIVRSIKEILENCIEGVAVDVEVLFKEATHNSPLKEIMGASLFVAFQKDLEKEVPAIIEKITGMHVSDSYDTTVTVLSLMLVYYGMSYIYEKCKGKKSEAIETSKNQTVQYIENYFNFPKEKIEESVSNIFKKNKGILTHVKNFVAPAKRDKGAEIIGGGRKIDKGSISDFPNDADIESEEEKEKQEPLQNVEIEIRAMDIDKNKSGWAGILRSIKDLSDKRLKMQIYPTIQLEDVVEDRHINIKGNIILVSKLQNDGNYKPYMFHLLEVIK
jgi:hypothetical protein